MGCGSGTLAVPLALAGHEVYAADFSPAMFVELMMRRARVEGVEELIHPIEMSWDEEWKAAPVCDVAFASRSIATQDMAAALLKLDAHARRRVCITLATATDTSPRADEVLLRAVGRTKDYASDYVYGMNILWQLGFQPDLSYIRSKRASDFTSFEEAIDTTCGVDRGNSRRTRPADRVLARASPRGRERAGRGGVELRPRTRDVVGFYILGK